MDFEKFYFNWNRRKKIKENERNVWDKVANQFSKIGPNYWNWFGKELILHSNISEGQKILDIGCGRGASLFPAAALIGKTGKVIGIDSSAAMIDNTKMEVQERMLKNVILECSSLALYQSESNSFDYIICGFGLGYIEADKNNYQVIRNALKENGEFGLSSWTHQLDQDWLTSLVNKYLEIEKKEEPKEKNNSFDMCLESGVKAILETAGFSNVRTKTVEKVFTFKDEEEWWEELNFNAVRNIIDTIKENNKLVQFKQEAFEGIKQFKNNEGIHFKRKAILAYCSK